MTLICKALFLAALDTSTSALVYNQNYVSMLKYTVSTQAEAILINRSLRIPNTSAPDFEKLLFERAIPILFRTTTLAGNCAGFIQATLALIGTNARQLSVAGYLEPVIGGQAQRAMQRLWLGLPLDCKESLNTILSNQFNYDTEYADMATILQAVDDSTVRALQQHSKPTPIAYDTIAGLQDRLSNKLLQDELDDNEWLEFNAEASDSDGEEIKIPERHPLTINPQKTIKRGM